MTRGPGKRLSSHEVAIWHTVDIDMRIDDGTLLQRDPCLTTFAPTLGEGERVLASGPFQYLSHVASGDGTYQHDSGFLFATGRYGLLATGAVAAGRAIGNSRRRAAAARAATPRWQVVDSGQVYVSTHGFYLQTVAGRLLVWGWGPITSAQLLGPRLLQINGESTSGHEVWMLESDWAELCFVLWSRVMHPQHPQRQGHVWIPEGWHIGVQESGVALPARRQAQVGGGRR